MLLANKKILLTGARGMLAGALIPKLAHAGCEMVLSDVLPGRSFDRSLLSLDITDGRAVRELVRELAPDWILNCGAFTKVDDAERNQEAAFNVNASGPGNLAKAARDSGAAMLHISTDYVFGGPGARDRARVPYTEDDVPCPCGIYGHSKRLGDEMVAAALPDDHLIVRTSWLHGVNGPNFLETILRLAKEREEIKVVNDQFGSPTWADWLAEMIVGLLQKDARGVYHATSRGGISWYDLAREIMAQAGLSTRVLPQSTEELARPAPRPAYSVLDVSKLEKFLGINCLSWQDGVRAHLAALSSLHKQ